VLAAGGSVPNLPDLKNRRLLEALPRMRPFEPAAGLTDQQWALAEPGRHYLVYSGSGKSIRLDLTGAPGSYTPSWLDPRTGACIEASEPVAGGKVVEFRARRSASGILWLARLSAAPASPPRGSSG
jgi:hypothetical protein